MSKIPGHILFIGPGLNANQSNLGGAVRSFENLLACFREKGLPHDSINTQEGSKWPRSLHITNRFLKLVWGADVVFMNLSQNGARTIGPLFYLLAKLLNKKVVFRPFGSGLKEVYQEASGLLKWLLRKTILKADIVYLQTEDLMRFFEPIGQNLKQLKTARKIPDRAYANTPKVYQKRFAFVGHLKESKGVDELLSAIKNLSDSYTIHLYGPIADTRYKELENASFYKGVLSTEQGLWQTLNNYDWLILPTCYEGEGYPGVIIEAYSLGLPVIATNWRSIPEIVIEGRTGILIEPRSTQALVQAIESRNAEEYDYMRREAHEFFLSYFDEGRVMDKLVEQLTRLT